MNIKEAQEKILEFDKARDWHTQWNLKDLSLNITEEVGEFWNLIKWIDDEKQKKIIIEKKERASDFIGDILFLVLKMANQMNVNADTALKNTLNEYERRMPAELMKKVKHANRLAGGVDKKDG